MKRACVLFLVLSLVLALSFEPLPAADTTTTQPSDKTVTEKADQTKTKKKAKKKTKKAAKPKALPEAPPVLQTETIAEPQPATPPVTDTIPAEKPAEKTADKPLFQPYVEPLVGIDAKVTTLGVGADFVVKIADMAKLRAGLQGYPSTKFYSGRYRDIKYDLTTDLFSAGLLLDIHPFYKWAWADGVRLTAGFLYNGNKYKMEGNPNPTSTYTIGGTTYTGAQIGKVTADIKFNPVNPYLGAGYTLPISPSNAWRIIFDAGAAFQGPSDVQLNCQNPASAVAAADIAREKDKLKKEADKFSVYPVLSLGVAYMF